MLHDVYVDDESAPVVISSLRLGDDEERDSLFTNSNWFAFDDEKVVNERSIVSPSPNADEDGHDDAVNDVVVGETENFNDIVASYHVWIVGVGSRTIIRSIISKAQYHTKLIDVWMTKS